MPQRHRTFDEWLAILDMFIAREHHARVPQSHEEAGAKLGQWVTVTRVRHNAGKLPAERVAALEAREGWTWTGFPATLDEAVASLRAYADANGGAARIRQDTVVDGFRLGRWASIQRSNYKAGTMSSARAAELESVPGWVWDEQEARWAEHLEQLRRYAASHDSASPPVSYVEDGNHLGRWALKQRINRRAGRLDDARATLLEQVPKWSWEIRGR